MNSVFKIITFLYLAVMTMVTLPSVVWAQQSPESAAIFENESDIKASLLYNSCKTNLVNKTFDKKWNYCASVLGNLYKTYVYSIMADPGVSASKTCADQENIVVADVSKILCSLRTTPPEQVAQMFVSFVESKADIAHGLDTLNLEERWLASSILKNFQCKDIEYNAKESWDNEAQGKWIKLEELNDNLERNTTLSLYKSCSRVTGNDKVSEYCRAMLSGIRIGREVFLSSLPVYAGTEKCLDEQRELIKIFQKRFCPTRELTNTEKLATDFTRWVDSKSTEDIMRTAKSDPYVAMQSSIGVNCAKTK